MENKKQKLGCQYISPEQLTHCELWQEFNANTPLEIGSTVLNQIENKKGSTVPNVFNSTFWNISFFNHFSMMMASILTIKQQ
ncbi:MAG: hypothetical protein WDZ35_12515 [Crocinitomicaceae bacterium]